MNTNEFLKATLEQSYEITKDGRKFSVPRPHVICKDGYRISIQANTYTYCHPRMDFASIYSEVELGYPSQYDELLDDYIEGPSNPTQTVYGYVPVWVVDKLLEKHGGIDHWENR